MTKVLRVIILGTLGLIVLLVAMGYIIGHNFPTPVATESVARKLTPEETETMNKQGAETEARRQAEVELAAKMRNLQNFFFFNAHEYDGEFGKILTYAYKTIDQRHLVELTVEPRTGETERIELEEIYSLDKNRETIAGVNVQYAFKDDIVFNGKIISKAYDELEFIYYKDEKAYIGFVNRTDAASDKNGLKATMNTFVKSLLEAEQRKSKP